ncbi:hypothetical protein ACIRQP_07515 [Streptomyces sp. NPDC102274]|uniref:hypothetical protein n=1 Tax=Streptomyces sp. NPDC102274 TaxID=3366151 RepID=UPI00380D2812
MSTAETETGGPQQSGPADDYADEDDTQQSPDSDDGSEEPDQPQDAWSARRDLIDHSPRSMRVGSGARFSGGLVGGSQHGVSGGQISGDVIMGSKTEIYHFGGSAAAHSSGEVPQATLERLAAHFVSEGTSFDTLAERLRAERILVLSGPHFTGRRTAALMLLHRLGASPVRALDRETSPTGLADQLIDDGQEDAPQEQHRARGYVLCDLITRRGRPLREAHILAARDRLAKDDGYLVITVSPTASLEDIHEAEWRPPTARAVLEAHLRVLTETGTTRELLDLPSVTEFLGRSHQLREAAEYAKVLARYSAGQTDEQRIGHFSLAALESQVQEWFEEDEASSHLRDKAFLVALAAFDGGPYALTAELSDLLYAFLQKTENPAQPPTVPVFGTHIGKRLQLARATRYEEEEHTEWGPVTQLKAAYLDDRASLVLLREVWTGHPSARAALVRWLRQLAEDGRPLVRTRAASTVAVLAYTDLPSAMALIIEPWATSGRFRQRLVAVNSLALTHLLGTRNVPRILDAWCLSEDQGLCWVSIRAHGLIGPERPEEALAALRRAARHQQKQEDPDEVLTVELAASVELLLLSDAAEQVLSELLRTLHDDRPVFDLALNGFLSACNQTKDDEPYGRPLILDWYAQAAAQEPGQAPAARGIVEMWRAALGDRLHTQRALDVLRHWVLAASRDSATEWALAALLAELVTSATERQRLAHLLRTMPGEDGASPPPVADRLLSVLPRR